MKSKLYAKRIKKTAVVAFAGILSLLCMGACRNNNAFQNSNSLQNEKALSGSYVYVPEYVALNDADVARMEDARIIGDFLYYTKIESAEQDSVRRYLCEYSLTQMKISRKILLS